MQAPNFMIQTPTPTPKAKAKKAKENMTRGTHFQPPDTKLTLGSPRLKAELDHPETSACLPTTQWRRMSSAPARFPRET
jgi:hypothetical protein